MSDEDGYKQVIAAVTEMGTRVEKRVDKLDERVEKSVSKLHERINEVGKTTGILEVGMARIEEKQKGSTWKSVSMVIGGVGTFVAAIVAILFKVGG